MTIPSAKLGLLSVINACVLAALAGGRADAQTIVLGAVEDFAIFSGATITNTGSSVVVGNIGVSPGTSITGFADVDGGPGVLVGTVHANDGLAASAYGDAGILQNQLKDLAVTTEPQTSGSLNRTFTPGVYFFDGAVTLDDTMIFDGEGLYVFQISTTLTTGSGANAILINGASAANIWFQVGTSATFGENTDFSGNIVAGASISLTAGANVDGRLVALTEGITLINNTITVAAVPEPSACAALAGTAALLGVIAMRRRHAV